MKILPDITHDQFAYLISVLFGKPELENYSQMPFIPGEALVRPLFDCKPFGIEARCEATEDGYTYFLRRSFHDSQKKAEVVGGFTAWYEPTGYIFDTNHYQLVREADTIERLKSANRFFNKITNTADDPDQGKAIALLQRFATEPFVDMLDAICKVRVARALAVKRLVPYRRELHTRNDGQQMEVFYPCFGTKPR